MKALSNIDRIQYRKETLLLLLNLYEFKGKIFYYDELFKNDLNALLDKTLEEDIKAISNIFNIKLTNARLNYISKKDFKPRNKEEVLLYNIKEIISLIHKDFNKFELLVNETEYLVKKLSNNYTKINFRKLKNDDLGLLEQTRLAKYEYSELIKLYTEIVRQNREEKLTVITNFYVDFINMEIFDNLNKEIALILLYVLIINEFPIFRYVSFFKHFDNYKKDFEHALAQACYSWASEFSQTDNLNEIIFHILKASFKELDDFANQFSFQIGLNKSDSIENSILKFNRQFTKEDIRVLHPTISDSTIERTLTRLRDENKIMSLGTGRGARWQIIVDNSEFKHISMFDDEF